MGRQVFGVTILSPQEQTSPNAPFSTTLEITNLDEVKAAEKQRGEFERLLRILYLDLVTEIHKYLIRLTPVHTGRLRGGWTAILDKYQKDYSRQITDTSLYDVYKRANTTKEYKDYNIDESAIEDGKRLSEGEDGLPGQLEVSVVNNVPYKDALDFGTSKIDGRHFTDRAQYRGEEFFRQQLEAWLSKISKAGAIVPPDEVPEITV